MLPTNMKDTAPTKLKSYNLVLDKLDTFTTSLQIAMKNVMKAKRQELLLFKSHSILKNPLGAFKEKEQYLRSEEILLNKEIHQILSKKQQDLAYQIQTVKLLNPLNILNSH